jgi:hypothetical protein
VSTSTTTTGFLSTLRRIAAGDTFNGLRSQEEMRASAASMKTERLLELRRETQDVLRAVREEDEAAHRGGSHASFLRRWAGRVSELGCPVGACEEPHVQHVLMILGARLKAIDAELRARFRRDGEPKALLDLRKRVADAKRAEWEPREAVRKARERVRALGVALCEGEAVAATASLAAAEKRTQALTRQLADEWPARS